MYEILNKLISISSPSGFEEDIASFIAKEMESFSDKVLIDTLGNVIARKAGTGKKLMLTAHMDEIGIISTYADENGFIRFSPLGSPDEKSMVGSQVIFLNGIRGVIGCEGKCELKDVSYAKCFVDIGASTKDEALSQVPIGSAGVFEGGFYEQNGKLMGKGLDDKIGCYILLETIRRIKGSPNDLYFVFTVQEELGLRGAKTAAFAVEADYAINIDVTAVGDISGENKMAVALGKGTAIKMKDNGIISHKTIVDNLINVATSGEIPYQLEVLDGGCTDVGAIHLTKSGVMAGGLSIPTRYIHSPNEMVDKNDVENTIKLLVFLLEKGI